MSDAIFKTVFSFSPQQLSGEFSTYKTWKIFLLKFWIFRPPPPPTQNFHQPPIIYGGSRVLIKLTWLLYIMNLDPVVQKVDSTISWINHPVGNTMDFNNTYP